MANIIVTRFEGKCKDCGTVLPIGSEARYYGRNGLYGVTCHPQQQNGKTPQVVGFPDLAKSFAPPLTALRRLAINIGEKPIKQALVVVPDLANSFSLNHARGNGKPSPVISPMYMVPGVDHRKKPGRATFRGKGMGMKCTSIRYYGTRRVPFTPPDDVMDALNGITRAGQAIGRFVNGGEYEPRTHAILCFRPALRTLEEVAA